ncbi:hypothetical protein [Nonomuraea sp. NPDC049758]
MPGVWGISSRTRRGAAAAALRLGKDVRKGTMSFDPGSDPALPTRSS